MTRLVDLSMPVHRDMLTFPRVPPPTLVMYESWQEFAERIGAAEHGADWLTASYLVIQNDHVGTHCDAVKHLRGPDAPGVEGIPLEYCFSDGVRLDFTRPGVRLSDHRRGRSTRRSRRSATRSRSATSSSSTRAPGAYNTEERYRTDHCGMTAEATRHLIAQGVRLMGIDAITFDPPVWAMFEGKHFWEAHRVMMDEDYWHLENLMNLEQLPPHGFKLSVFPIKWLGTTAAPVRAVAIVED